MARAGFVLLGERPGREIALGTVVQPWKAVTDNIPHPHVDAEGFAAFHSPGFVKVAFNVRVEPYGRGRSLLTTETRERRPLMRQASVASPGTGCSLARSDALIRRLMLRIVKADAVALHH